LTTQWQVDATHSSIDFAVKHMMIANVRGTFHKFDANIVADANDLTTADVKFTIDVTSIDTRNKDRDAHLLSADFFDAEKYPTITFQSTEIQKTGDGEYLLTGDLSMHGVTRPVKFQVTLEGFGKDPWGNERAGFSAQTTINRKDFGLNWNAVLETGGVLVSDEVKVSVQLEAIKA
jgi:polyisoprenoid-binding protein YceI